MPLRDSCLPCRLRANLPALPYRVSLKHPRRAPSVPDEHSLGVIGLEIASTPAQDYECPVGERPRGRADGWDLQ